MKRFLYGAAALAFAALPYINSVDSYAASTDLKITAIETDVQGDATLLESKGKYLLMDTGVKNAGNQLYNYLDEHNITTFDMYLSHYHGDHYGNMNDIINNPKYTVKTVYVPALPDIYNEEEASKYITDETLRETYKNTFASLKALIAKYEAAGIKIVKLQNGSKFNFGDAKIEIIGPNKSCFFTVDQFAPTSGQGGDAMGHFLNNSSLAARITTGKTVFLTLGDTELEEEACLMQSGQNLHADIMKLSHHGGWTSNGSQFMQAVNPTYTYYQLNSEHNATSFANSSWVKNVILDVNSRSNVLSTEWNGTITYTIHNDTINVSTERHYKTATLTLLNEDNGKIISQETVHLNDNTNYFTDARVKRNIPGYTYSRTEGATTGKVTADTKIISYYKKNAPEPTEPTQPTEPAKSETKPKETNNKIKNPNTADNAQIIGASVAGFIVLATGVALRLTKRR